MSHMFESGFFVGEAPWHGLGNIVPEDTRYSVSEGIIAAGLNWDVYTVPCGLRDTIPMEGDKPRNMWTCRRVLVTHEDGTTHEEEQILGLVGGGYKVVQNEELFQWFQPYLESGEAYLHTAGSLNHGRWVWVLAKINRAPLEIVPGDYVEKFLLLSSSHDGTQALRVGFTPIRVVCANTLSLAHKQNSNLLRLKHTKMIHATLDQVHEIVDLVDQRFEATAEQFRALANRKIINPKDLESYVIRVLTEGKSHDPSEISTKMHNIIYGKDGRPSVMSRVQSQAQKVPQIEGTWWAAYNAITEHLTWAAGGDGGEKTTISDKINNRLASLWFGKNQSINEMALELALEMSA